MSTMTGNKRRAVLWGLAALGFAVVAANAARAADVVSDRSGAILMYPKIVVDTKGQLFDGKHVDTEVQLTNTSKSVIAARCYIIEGTYRCSKNPLRACRSDAVQDSECGTCNPPSACQERDFRLTLTKRQPISWKASEGLNPLPCSGNCFNGGDRDGDNKDSAIPVVPGDPFMGEIRCVEADPETWAPVAGFNPANNGGGDLKGEATIVTVDTKGKGIDARKYNAIGIEAIEGANDGNDILVLGGDGAEYAGCPNILLLDHMFEGAAPVTHLNATLSTEYAIDRTDLTVVPCAWNLEQQTTSRITLQFLIFNEFEQRFSTSTPTGCWRETALVDIDTRLGDSGEDKYSIFNVFVQGTLTGQTRIRSVAGSSTANTVLAITEEFWNCKAGTGACTDAGNTHFTGVREGLSDRLVLACDPDNPNSGCLPLE